MLKNNIDRYYTFRELFNVSTNVSFVILLQIESTFSLHLFIYNKLQIVYLKINKMFYQKKKK